jgi:hypothetical protein
MANQFIGDYPTITSVTQDTDLVPIVQGGELKTATPNSIKGYKEYEGLITASGSAITENRLHNDFDGISLSYNSGYVEISCTAGFSANTSVKVTFGEESGSSTQIITLGGYRFSDGNVYIWVAVNNVIDVNAWLTKATVNIREY